MSEDRVKRRLTAILVADVVGYSRLMGRDERGTLIRLKSHRAERLEPLIGKYGGRLIKLTGDGALVEFPSAVDALTAAIQFQEAVARTNHDQPEDTRVVFRVGLHLGDLIVEGDDLYGDSVNVAARLEAQAPPGGIVISSNLHDAVVGRLDATFDDLGELALKNIERPVRAFRVSGTGFPAISSATRAYAVEAPIAFSDKPSIAVLPFANLSNDPQQDYFADGLAEDVTAALSRTTWLRVISRSAAFSFKDKPRNLRSISGELTARYLVEGSVRVRGDEMRVSIQLTDSATSSQLWIGQYDRRQSDVFAVQDEITWSVVSALQPALARVEMQRSLRKPPNDLTAWDLLLRARSELHQLTKSSNDQAKALLLQAVSKDSGYAEPHVWLSVCFLYEAFFGWSEHPRKSYEQAALYAALAARLDPEDAGPLYAMSSVLATTSQANAAVAIARRAIELDPNSAAGYRALGAALSFTGDAEEAIKASTRSLLASGRDQFRFLDFISISNAHFCARRPEEAFEWARKCTDLMPNWLGGFLNEAVAAGELGDSEQAASATRRLLALVPGFRVRWVRKNPCFQRPDDIERFVSRLAEAGLPE